jgi:DegV family protein with EDD domain
MVRIITDTTACLPSDFAEQHHVPVISQIVSFGDESFFEGIEMDQETFLRRLKTSVELPKTAAPPPELFVREFQRLVPLGEPIICIHPSAEISGTVRSAIVAARDFPEADIRVIDTRMVAGPLAKMVQIAALWAESGKTADTIQAGLRDLTRRARIYFMVPTLEFLAKGGRIGGASALLGSLLQVKPILTLRDGRVETYEKARTQKRAITRLKEIVTEHVGGGKESHLLVMHADVLLQAQALASALQDCLGFTDIAIFDLPPAIVVHGGPGLLGVAFFLSE